MTYNNHPGYTDPIPWHLFCDESKLTDEELAVDTAWDAHCARHLKRERELSSKLETMTRAVQKDDELIADLKAEVERLIGVNRAQGERHAKRCEEWAKTADEEREAKESALLQLSEAKDLLRKVEDQGVFHSCGSDLWPDGKMKCPECEAGLEGQILKLLGASIENRVDVPECGNCGGDLVRKTEPTWICPKCEL